MPTNNLRITLIATGAEAGTWGTTTNTNLGTLLDGGIAGYVVVNITAAAQALAANTGVPDEARMATLKLDSTLGTAFTLYAPPVSKQYIIWNNTGQTATVRNSTLANGTTPAPGGTTVTINNGEKIQVFSDGTNFYASTPKVLNSVANGVVYANSSNQVTNGTALTFDGTNLGVGTLAPSSKIEAVGANVSIKSTASSGYGSFYATGATGDAAYYFMGINGTETARITSTAANYMAFSTGSASVERMRIDSDGNVQVGSSLAGISAPGGGRFFDIDNFENTDAASYAVARLITYNVAGSATVSFDIYKAKGGAVLLNNNETDSAAYIGFGIGPSERMRLDSSGVLTLNSVPVVTTTGTQTLSNKTLSSNTVGTTQSNGDNSTKLATTAYVQNMGLGWGQTWQDVVGSRALGSDYTNSTGKPIMVSVSITGSPNNGVVSMTVNGVIIGYQGVQSVASAVMTATISAIVPPGAVYRADNYNGASLNTWVELR
jgi:hypothetical protein